MKCWGATNSATFTSNFSCAAALVATPAAASALTSRLMRPPPPLFARRLYVAVRVLRLPAPGIAAHGIDLELGAPLEHRARARGVGVARGDIARSARQHLVGNRATAGSLEGFHGLEHRVAVP